MSRQSASQKVAQIQADRISRSRRQRALLASDPPQLTIRLLRSGKVLVEVAPGVDRDEAVFQLLDAFTAHPHETGEVA